MSFPEWPPVDPQGLSESAFAVEGPEEMRKPDLQKCMIRLLLSVHQKLDVLDLKVSHGLAHQHEQGEVMASIQQEVADLGVEVGETQGAQASAAVLIDGLSDRLDELIANGSGSDPALEAKVAELRDALRSSREALSAKVAENPVP